MATISISSLAEMDSLGMLLAHYLPLFKMPPVFLYGVLGAGKTALVKAVVSHFAGSEKAEPGSPSFNLCNYYPVNPPILHCDLYRCGSALPEELMEALDGHCCQVFLEWSEYYPKEELPSDYLDISINLDDDERLLKLTAYGPRSEGLLDSLLNSWHH